MAIHRLQRTFLLIAAIVSQGWIAECDGVSCNATDVEEASIGKEFTLHCSVSCPNGPYRWFNDTGQQALLQENGADLMVSERVESAAAVGGQRYACQCEETGVSECYTIWVTPYVQLNVSKEVVKLGSSVTISCSAESYPPANNVAFFQLQHPSESDISHSLLTLLDNGVEYHVANASGSDGGEYDCIVNVYETLDGWLSQNQSKTYLTVYEPPVIIETAVMLSSICGEGLAVVECVVENVEPMLEVWVNWTTGNGSDSFLGDSYTMRRVGGGVFILLRHKVAKYNGNSYTCQLFSMYSPQVSEDSETVEIKFQRCTNTSELKGSKSEGCQHWKIAIVFVTGFFVVALAIFFILVVVLVWKKNRGKKMMTSNNGKQDEVRYNKTQEEVDIENRDRHSDAENVTKNPSRPENGTVDTFSNHSSSTASAMEDESTTPVTDLKSQENENSETDSMEDVFSSSPSKNWPQNGHRPSMSGGRRRNSSTSSYRRGSGPEGKNLIKN